MFEDGVWRTVGGRRIFIKTGQSLSDAMKKSGKFKLKKEELEKKEIKKDEEEVKEEQNKKYKYYDDNDIKEMQKESDVEWNKLTDEQKKH